MGGSPEALVTVLLLVAGVCANLNENGPARRPPMGWRSWNLFGAAVDQRLMERVMAGLEDRSRLVDGAPTSDATFMLPAHCLYTNLAKR